MDGTAHTLQYEEDKATPSVKDAMNRVTVGAGLSLVDVDSFGSSGWLQTSTKQMLFSVALASVSADWF